MSKASSASIVRTNLSNGHTRPKAPQVSLNEYGHLKVANLLVLFNCSHSTFYNRKAKGLYPKEDLRVGGSPVWLTSTVREYLERR